MAAIAEAASDYRAGSAESTANLVSAASAVDALPTLGDVDSAERLGLDGTTVEFNDEGGAVASLAGGNSLGVDVGGEAASTKFVDGVAVTTASEGSAEFVTRVTDGGMQVVAVLADDTVSTDVNFNLALPAGAELVQQRDGSISIVGDVESVVAIEGEEDRVTEAASQILGGSEGSIDDLENLSDEQIEQPADIPDAATEVVSERGVIAEIEAPWAVDAHGNALPTHYELDGDVLVQKVETASDTAFPVTADPSWTWWVQKGASCLGGAIALGTMGYAKVAVGVAKLVVKMKAAKSAGALGRAYTAWKKLGTSNSAIVKELVKQMKALGTQVRKHGYSGIARHKKSSTKAAASITLLKDGARVVGGVFGLGACVDMLMA